MCARAQKRTTTNEELTSMERARSCCIFVSKSILIDAHYRFTRLLCILIFHLQFTTQPKSRNPLIKNHKKAQKSAQECTMRTIDSMMGNCIPLEERTKWKEMHCFCFAESNFSHFALFHRCNFLFQSSSSSSSSLSDIHSSETNFVKVENRTSTLTNVYFISSFPDCNKN